MPKTTSKSFKKKKYNARFPPARIKKIMQTDEEVGKVAAAVPVIISRALEMFIESLITETAKLTQAKNAKTLSTSHIKQTIKSTSEFDFLHDLVKNVPDHQTEDNNGDSAVNGESSVKKGKGRPRKFDGPGLGKKRKSVGNKSSSDEEEEEDEEEDDTEDTETDEELTSRIPSCPTDSSTSKTVRFLRPEVIGAPPNQGHNPVHPSLSENTMSHNNNNNNNSNNNNYVPSAAGPAPQTVTVLRDSIISGKNIQQVLHHQNLPLSGNIQLAPPLLQLKQPMYQVSSSFEMPSGFSPHMPPKSSLYHNNTPFHPVQVTAPNPVIQSSIQQQPIDLTYPLRQQNNGKEDDDYDT